MSARSAGAAIGPYQEGRRPSPPSHTRAEQVTVGVDTHGDVHAAWAIDQVGRRLAIADFATTPTGYRAVLEWAQKLGEVQAFGVEGCGCDGAGLARFLGAQAT